jgi:hypothetical protein
MGKKNRLSRDQKRKAKLAKQAKKAAPMNSLAITGNKYKTEELVPVVMRTEVGIYEAYVLTGRTLTDRAVAAALTHLVLEMRKGPLPPFDPSAAVRYVPGNEEDLIIGNILRNWEDLFSTVPRRGDETLQGILRTLLGSIDVWSTPNPQSRGYLHFLEGFLRKAGVTVDRLAADGTLEEDPEAEDDLLAIGREWCFRGDREAGKEFHEYAQELMREGEGEYVAEICQRLIGETGGDKATMLQLSTLALEAHELKTPRLEGKE